MTTPFEASRSVDTDRRGAERLVGQSEVDDVIEALRDGVCGYAALADRVEDPDHRQIIEQRLASRRTTTDTLVATVAEMGDDVGERPSLAASFHRGWLKVKSLLGDHPAIEAAVHGEDHALSEIDDALETDIPEELADAIRAARRDVEQDREALVAAT